MTLGKAVCIGLGLILAMLTCWLMFGSSNDIARICSIATLLAAYGLVTTPIALHLKLI